MKTITLEFDNNGNQVVSSVLQNDETAEMYANGCKYCGFQEIQGKILVLESKYGKIVKIVLNE